MLQSLQEMTVQIHEGSTQVDSIDRVISSIVQRFPNIDINMELHASNSDEVKSFWNILIWSLFFSMIALRYYLCLLLSMFVLSIIEFT